MYNVPEVAVRNEKETTFLPPDTVIQDLEKKKKNTHHLRKLWKQPLSGKNQSRK